METPNYRKASIYFDDETVLEVTQRGGGGSGVGGETGLEAVNLITGESTNTALAAKDETIAEQAETIETQAATITEQGGTIEELQTELANAASPVFPGSGLRQIGLRITNSGLSARISFGVGFYRDNLRKTILTAVTTTIGNSYSYQSCGGFVKSNTATMQFKLPNEESIANAVLANPVAGFSVNVNNPEHAIELTINKNSIGSEPVLIDITLA